MGYKPILIVVISLLLLSNTCKKDSCHQTITFRNNSDKAVYIKADDAYPDTMYFQTYAGLVHNANTAKVIPNSSNSEGLRVTPSCWENVIGGIQVPSDTIMIFVFDAEHIENLSWSEIVSNYMVLKRYELSLDDLNHINWTINYP